MRRGPALSFALLLACAPKADADKDAPATPATKVADDALPLLSADEAQKVAEAVRNVDSAVKAQIATQGLAELEVARLPPFLLDAMTASVRADPSQRALQIAKAIDSVAGRMAWIQACRGGVQVFQGLATIDPSERGPYLWRECGLSELRLADEATITAADPTQVLFAILAFDHLRRHGEVTADEREILAAMLTPPAPPSAAEAGEGAP